MNEKESMSHEALKKLTKKELAIIYCNLFYKGRKEYDKFLELALKGNTKKKLIRMIKGAKVWLK
jgi:hypothetical protein